MRKKPGYTFVEIIVALGLVATATLAFGAMIPMAARSARTNANYQQAMCLIQHKIDQCRVVGWGRLNFAELRAAGIIDASPTSSPYHFETTDNLTSVYPSAQGTLEVSDVRGDIRQLTVTVRWADSPVRQGNGSLSTVTQISED
jgi:type II secretory pathway pseudopilin PulG